jgi:peptidoglycan hydrolase-like protein with peptidoglycan-binding domain
MKTLSAVILVALGFAFALPAAAQPAKSDGGVPAGGGRGRIEAVQQALKDKGHDPGDIDGRMGPKTTAALRDFQKKEGLSPTGRVDFRTAEKLGLHAKSGSRATATEPKSPQVTAPTEAKKAGPGASTSTPEAEMGRDAAGTKRR